VKKLGIERVNSYSPILHAQDVSMSTLTPVETETPMPTATPEVILSDSITEFTAENITVYAQNNINFPDHFEDINGIEFFYAYNLDNDPAIFSLTDFSCENPTDISISFNSETGHELIYFIEDNVISSTLIFPSLGGTITGGTITGGSVTDGTKTYYPSITIDLLNDIRNYPFISFNIGVSYQCDDEEIKEIIGGAYFEGSPLAVTTSKFTTNNTNSYQKLIIGMGLLAAISSTAVVCHARKFE